MASIRKGLVSGGTGFLSRAVSQILVFVVTILATRILSLEAFGSFALASSFIILTRSLFYVGPYEYLLKSREDNDLRRACLSANVVLSFISIAFLSLFFFLSPVLFDTPNVSTLIAWLAPSVFLVAITAWYEANLLRAMRTREYFVSTLVCDCIGATVAILLLWQGFGVVALVAQTYGRLGSLLIIYTVIADERPSLALRSAETVQILQWSRARYAAVLLNFTSAYGADFVLGILLSPAATGLYRASSRIVSSLADLFAQPLQKIAQANISARFVRSGKADTLWLRMLAGVGAIGWAALTGLALLAHDIVPFVLGEKWAAAAPIVVVFCIVKCLSLLDAVTTAFLACHDQQHAMFKVQAGVAAMVIAFSASFSSFGPAVVAIAVGCATASMSLTYGSMVMRLSNASRSALLDLLATSAPPVVGVGVALMLRHWLWTAGQTNLQTLVLTGSLAVSGFLIGAYIARRRILMAISSLAAPQFGVGEMS
jgi:O-antigen/teichoic acid export membrane protein